MCKFKHCFEALLLVALSITVLVSGAYAQYADEDILPRQGDVLLSGALLGVQGGGLGAYYTDIENSRNISLNLSGDYLFTDNFAFGLSLIFAESKGGDETFRTTGFGARVSYFLRPTGGNALPYLSLGYAGLDLQGVRPSGFSVGGGVQVFLTRSVALDLGLGYVNLRASGQTADGFNVGLGLTFWLRRD